MLNFECVLWQRLTGGTLIARDKEFIVLYRGKDFLPPAVSSAIKERRKAVMYADNRSRKLRISATTAQDHESRTELETKDDLTGGLPSEKRKLKSTEAAASTASIKLSMVWLSVMLHLQHSWFRYFVLQMAHMQ